MLLERKLNYAQRFKKDALYVSALQELIPVYGAEGNKMLTRTYALELGRRAQSKEERKLAMEWLEQTLNEKNAVHLLDNAEIYFLYKQKGKGLKCVNSALDLTEEGTPLHERAAEMKKKNAREMKLLKQVINEIN